jgi:hypothetical protein
MAMYQGMPFPDTRLKIPCSFEGCVDPLGIHIGERDIRSNFNVRSSEKFERWSLWALAQADRIDPVTGGVFLSAMQDEDDITS